MCQREKIKNMQNYIAPGDVLTVVAAAAIVSGQGLLVGDMLTVAAGSAAIGESVSVITEGVFTLPKRTNASTAAILQGAAVYWDNTAKVIDNTSNTGANKLAGYAYVAAVSTAATVQVRLIG